MNYINISDEEVILKVNINYDFNLEEGRNGDDIDFYMYKDGLGIVITELRGNITVDGDVLEWAGNVELKPYYETVVISEDAIEELENDTSYSLLAVARINNKDKVVYRGKVHTTRQLLSEYSINKNKYKQKTNTNDYTILD